VLPEQVQACADLDEDGPCNVAGLSSGICLSGVCETSDCGNLTLDPGEACDDGNADDGDGCSADCRSNEACGNGRLDAVTDEQCDDGNRANGDECQADCSLPRCGDGYRDEAEACDDGNADDGDGCSADCRSNETCGNGRLDEVTGEQCDDGNLVDGDGCQRICALPGCGDGHLDDGEACDDGNAVSGDGCNKQCSSTEGCGNGVIDAAAGETCDEGDVVDGDGCSAECRLEGCGNSVVEPERGEVCDDGNTSSADGCRADCRKVEVCGDGAVDAGEACDDGNVNPGDGCDDCAALRWQATAISGQHSEAMTVGLARPAGLAVDDLGNLFIADMDNDQVRRLNIASAQIVTVAGTGGRGDSGDGGPATSAELDQPSGVTVDGLGNLFVADARNHRIRRVDGRTGRIDTVAGIGSGGYSGDGALAAGSALSRPEDVAVDGLGNLFIADSYNDRIRRVDGRTGVITTVAGSATAGYSGDGASATDAQLFRPTSVVVQDDGSLLIADQVNQRIRRVDGGSGIITTFAGTGARGYSGDGGAATAAQINTPRSLAMDGAGGLLFADAGNHCVRRVDLSDGVITTIAGVGIAGYDGDGGAATSALLNGPHGVAVDGQGDVFISDRGSQRVRRIDSNTGVITTVVGAGTIGYTGDGGLATSAYFMGPTGVAVDALGNVFIADSLNARIRFVDQATGLITTVAGTATDGYSGDGGPAVDAQLDAPKDVALDAAGNLYIADSLNYRIRRVDGDTGAITSVAGTGSAGYSGDGGLATSAQLTSPAHVTSDESGNLFITTSYRIRRVDEGTGVITTVAGTGVGGYSGDAGPATSAQISPAAVAVDGQGNLFISDYDNARVRRVDALTGIITTVVGTGAFGSGGDGGPATSAQLVYPWAIVVDAFGNLYVAGANNRVRRVDAMTGLIDTVAGGVQGYSGDGGPATGARLRDIRSLALDGAGNLFILHHESLSFGSSGLVRRVDAGNGIISTVAGRVDPEGMGPLSRGRLADPRALVRSDDVVFVAGGGTGTVQAVRSASQTVEVVAGRYLHDVATDNLARFRDRDFGDVLGVAFDAEAGMLFLSESTSHTVHAVTLVDPDDESTWSIDTLAGDGVAGFGDGPAATARLREPSGLFFDAADKTLYVADSGNHAIRAVDLSAGVDAATVSTVVGRPGTLGFFGDGGPASNALLYRPHAVTLCDNGHLFIADTDNSRVRRVDGGGTITTVLGDGTAASSGQGFPAWTFPVDTPLGLDCDDSGNLIVSSRTAVRLVSADDAGVVDGSGTVTSIFGAPPRDMFPASDSSCITAVQVLDATRVHVTDSCTGMLIELERGVAP